MRVSDAQQECALVRPQAVGASRCRDVRRALEQRFRRRVAVAPTQEAKRDEKRDRRRYRAEIASPRPEPIARLAAAARDDPATVGLALTGSHAGGTADEHSDVDAIWVLTDDALVQRRARSEPDHVAHAVVDGVRADLVYSSPSALTALARHPGWWSYGYASARVLVDKTGEVAERLHALGRIRADEAATVAYEAYDAYVHNFSAPFGHGSGATSWARASMPASRSRRSSRRSSRSSGSTRPTTTGSPRARHARLAGLGERLSRSDVRSDRADRRPGAAASARGARRAPHGAARRRRAPLVERRAARPSPRRVRKGQGGRFGEGRGNRQVPHKRPTVRPHR